MHACWSQWSYATIVQECLEYDRTTEKIEIESKWEPMQIFAENFAAKRAFNLSYYIRLCCNGSLCLVKYIVELVGKNMLGFSALISVHWLNSSLHASFHTVFSSPKIANFIRSVSCPHLFLKLLNSHSASTNSSFCPCSQFQHLFRSELSLSQFARSLSAKMQILSAK
jgi:hypothetical protein